MTARAEETVQRSPFPSGKMGVGPSGRTAPGRFWMKDPQHARAMNKLGEIFARRNDLRQAELCFNEAIALDPHLASAHSNLGNIYAERGWRDRAQAAYEQALLLDPGNPTATHNLGVLYRKKRRHCQGSEPAEGGQPGPAEAAAQRGPVQSQDQTDGAHRLDSHCHYCPCPFVLREQVISTQLSTGPVDIVHNFGQRSS